MSNSNYKTAMVAVQLKNIVLILCAVFLVVVLYKGTGSLHSLWALSILFCLTTLSDTEGES